MSLPPTPAADAGMDVVSVSAATGAAPPVPRLSGRSRRGRRLVKPEPVPTPALTAEQRLLLFDTWQRSGLPAGDFAAMVGLSKHTLYGRKKKFDEQGPAGLMDQPRGARKGSGKSVFTRELEKRGIKQIVAAPRRPQTLGKIERFWGTLWRECIESAVFVDLGDAQRRIGL
ncbi:MAG: integrase core domain-containing protein, partial [Gemmataceae bacterium]|nr:integrase core domain-containing protein [Gemmataceae bacterium]